MLQKEYGSFYRAVSDILFRHNPMELDGKHNTGDYNPEVDVLLSRIREAEDLNTLLQLLFEVFVTDFGEENCGNRTLRGCSLGDLEVLRTPPCDVSCPWRIPNRFKN